MVSRHAEIPFSPFALLTNRLILVPTPTAISLPSYLALYASLHARSSFCEMAFSSHFPATTWSDEQTIKVINTRDIVRCWRKRGMGDFAVGLRVNNDGREGVESDTGRILEGPCQEIRIIEGNDVDRLFATEGQSLDAVEWVGYAGVRDATTTSMPAQTADDLPLPPWQEMIELRYGVAPEYWGQGIAREAAEAIMQWAVSERGVRRFIAETENGNTRSGRVLEKMGFKPSGTEYWREPSEVEWERILR
ncbi:acyl-CoA N-acyltransferase [Zopfia rhizophila CBS 207.26]|uniref:Acyl-CoA N-acyltransferase n=1 Tax=Zopfia rhizophila CBS 207.26 TaxID=1314779 RepID=A0A6A6DZ75_9PEZI|nr:acyl-CoA N-acyltransferase [Zopfia rhizophila CBS 207.26]